jgi:hypothetical protein
MFCRFAPERDRLAQAWSDIAFTELHWRKIENVGHGESGCELVEEPGGLRGFAKPAVSKRQRLFRGAHEKIAFDLAHACGIPVPPVLLYRASSGQLFSISAPAFYEFEPWNSPLSKSLTSKGSCLQSVSAAFAAGRVFHTWIADQDRKDEHVLLDLRARPEAMGLAFIDHAMSLSHSWKTAVTARWDICDSYLPGVPPNVTALGQTVGLIQSCSDRLIKEICNRVPVDFLPDDRRDIIVAQLIQRRGELEQHFLAELGATA